MITIKDVAKRAGISIAAVSYALNDKEGVNEETRKKVKEIAQEMGYVPNSLAQGLLSKKTNIIGLIVPDISDVYMATFIKYLEKHARRENFFILLGSTGGKLETEKDIVNSLISKNIDGLIIAPGNSDSEMAYREIADSLNKRHIPFILTNLSYPGIKCNYVVPDLEEGEYQITRHLLEHGFRNLVFVGGEISNHYSKVRYEGFLRAFRELGLSLETAKYLQCGRNFSFNDGYHSIDKFLSENKLPEVFVAVNDSIAYGLIKGLKEHGIRVPKDVGMVGFDDLELPTMDTVPLTTVKIPLEEMARLCIEILKENVNRKVLKQFTVPTEVIIRESVWYSKSAL